MNTKFLMIGSAVYFASLGLMLTFIPQESHELLGIGSGPIEILMSQTLGAGLLAFAMLNWMTRGNILGGIYGKPVMMTNFLFFFVSSMAYLKSGENILIWTLAAFCSVFAAIFGYVAFTHPFKER